MYSRRLQNAKNSAGTPTRALAVVLAVTYFLFGCSSPRVETFGTNDAEGTRTYWRTLEAAHYSKAERRKVKPPEKCLLCRSNLVWATSIEDSDLLARNNLELLAGTASPTPLSFASIKVCTNCWFSFNSTWGRTERALYDPSQFQPALQKNIREFPLASLPLQSKPVFKEAWIGQLQRDEVAFWCEDNKIALEQLEAYARKTNLLLEIDRGRQKKSLFVRATGFATHYR